MSEDNGNLIETVEFRAIAPKGDLRGLDEPIKKLERLDTLLKALNNRLAGLSTGSQFKQTAAQFSAKIPTSGPQSVRKLARLMGLPDVKDVEAYARDLETTLQASMAKLQRKLDKAVASPSGSTRARDNLRKQIKDLEAQSLFTGADARTLLNPTRAGQFLEGYSKRLLGNQLDVRKAIQGMLAGTPVGAANAGPVFPVKPAVENAKSKGQSLKAKVESGKDETEGPAEKASSKAGAKFRDAMAAIKRELAENLNTGDLQAVAGARSRASANVRALVEDGEIGGKVKQRVKDQALTFAATQDKGAAEALEKHQATQASATFEIRKKLAKAQTDKDKAAEKQLKEELAQAQQSEAATRRMAAQRQQALKQLDRAFYAPAARREELRLRSEQNEAQRRANYERGQSNVKMVSQAWQDFIANGGVVTHDEQVAGKGGMKRKLRGEMQMGAPGTPGASTRVFSAEIGETDAKMQSYAKTAVDARNKTNWLGSDFLTNTAKVAKWALSVGVLYKTMELAEHSMSTFLTTSGQMARLDQIFRQVGGSTLDLTSDILHLAAVTGRSGDEAMESAISWSRLGLNRIQVNEAVRLSLMAANVTQLEASETTEHLQAISQNYGLTVGSLSSKLGEMVRISNVYNVTNADMLQGVSRSAAVAKQAGMSFEELIGLIGGTVGATKQTGANIGNAIKTIITSLGSPVLQDKLKMLYGIHSEGPGGKALPVTGVLDEIFVRYQKLDNLQQRAMTFSISGKFQSQRLSAMLDNYVKAQVLAIDAQLHLNTAEQENLKIVGSLKAQLSGLSAEWERFVVVQGSNGPALALGEIAKALRNVLGLLDTKGGSLLTTGLLGIGTVAIAKTALTAMTTKAGANSGFVGATQKQALAAAMALNGFTNTAINGFVDRSYNRSGSSRRDRAARTERYTEARKKGYTVEEALNLAGPAARAPGYARGIGAINAFGNSRLQASARGFQEMRVAAAAANAVIGATAKSLALASVALYEFALPIAAVVGGVMLFNHVMDAMEGGAEASRKKLAGFNEEMERSAAAASAMGQASKLFQTAIQVLSPQAGAVSKKNAFRIFDQLQDAMFLNEPDLEKRKKLQATQINSFKSSFVEGGDNSAITKSLQGQSDAYYQAKQEELFKNQLQRQDKQEELSAQRTKLEGMNKSPTAMDRMFGEVEKRNKQIEEIKAQQAEVNGQIVQGIQEELSMSDELLSTDQRVTAELAKQKSILAAISSIFGSIHTTNPLEKWAVELTSAEARLMALKKQKEELDVKDKTNTAEQAKLSVEDDSLKQKQDTATQKAAMWQQITHRAEGMGRDWQDLSGRPVDSAYSQAADKLGFHLPDSDLNDANAHQQIKNAKKEFAELQHKRDQIQKGLDPLNPGQITQESVNKKLQADNVEQTVEATNARDAILAQKKLAGQHTRIEMGQQESERIMTANDFGASNAEKLTNQRQAMMSNIATTEEEIKHTREGSDDALQLQGRLLDDIYNRNKLNLDILHEQASVEAQIKQLKIDQNKEFMRSFMGAGPSEMLQKLTAFKMSFDQKGNRRAPMSQGEFFAMSPEMRANYGQLNPQYSPAMIELQRARSTAAGAIKGFAGGGYTGDGPKDGIAGVVHFGEYVYKAGDVDSNGMPKTTAGWADYDRQKRAAAWKKQYAGLPETTAGWAEHDRQDRQAEWEKLTAGKLVETTTAGWAIKDKHDREAAWQAKYGGRGLPETTAGWAAKDKADRIADWQKRFGGNGLPETEAGWAARNKQTREANWEAKYGGPDWESKQAAATAPRLPGDDAATKRPPGYDPRPHYTPAHDLQRAREKSAATTAAHEAVNHQIAKGYGVDTKSSNQRVDAAVLAGSEQLAKVLAKLPASLETGLTASAAAVEKSANNVAVSLDRLAAKLERWNPGGSGGNFAHPQSAQTGGLGGGRGFSQP